MGRAKQPEIRERLLDACTDHALQHGLPDRLGSFATATDTSARMLVYHFGTKEQLQREVLQTARARQRRDWEALLDPKPGEPYVETLRKAWPGMTRARGRRYIDLFSRLREDAEQELWPGFRQEATTDWLAPLERGMATLGRPELSTLVLAVIRGLILDLQATEDHERVDRAFTDFVDSLLASA